MIFSCSFGLTTIGQPLWIFLVIFLGVLGDPSRGKEDSDLAIKAVQKTPVLLAHGSNKGAKQKHPS